MRQRVPFPRGPSHGHTHHIELYRGLDIIPLAPGMYEAGFAVEGVCKTTGKKGVSSRKTEEGGSESPADESYRGATATGRGSSSSTDHVVATAWPTSRQTPQRRRAHSRDNDNQVHFSLDSPPDSPPGAPSPDHSISEYGGGDDAALLEDPSAADRPTSFGDHHSRGAERTPVFLTGKVRAVQSAVSAFSGGNPSAVRDHHAPSTRPSPYSVPVVAHVRSARPSDGSHHHQPTHHQSSSSSTRSIELLRRDCVKASRYLSLACASFVEQRDFFQKRDGNAEAEKLRLMMDFDSGVAQQVLLSRILVKWRAVAARRKQLMRKLVGG